MDMSRIKWVTTHQFGIGEVLADMLREEMRSMLKKELAEAQAEVTSDRQTEVIADAPVTIGMPELLIPTVAQVRAASVSEPDLVRNPGETDEAYRARKRSERSRRAAKSRSLNSAERKRAAAEVVARTRHGPNALIDPGRVVWDDIRSTSIITMPRVVSQGSVSHPAPVILPAVEAAAETSGTTQSFPDLAHEEVDLDLGEDDDEPAEDKDDEAYDWDESNLHLHAPRAGVDEDEDDEHDRPTDDEQEDWEDEQAKAEDNQREGPAGSSGAQAAANAAAAQVRAGDDDELATYPDIHQAIRDNPILMPTDSSCVVNEANRISATRGASITSKADIREAAQQLADERQQLHDEQLERERIADEAKQAQAKSEAAGQASQSQAQPAPASIQFDPGLLAIIERAALRPGPVFLYGGTATGKTSMPIHIAAKYGYQVVVLPMEPGYSSDNTYGTMVAGNPWKWEDGPLCLWARQAAAGIKTYLIVDEIGRGSKNTVSEFIPITSVWSASQVQDLGYALPKHGHEPYHVIRVPLTHEVFVFSVEIGKIWATTNLGDSYDGLSLNDPAFRNRWTGGFIYIKDHTSDQLKDILAKYAGPAVGRADTHNKDRVIKALVVAHEGIKELQDREDCLAMTTNLRTLIAWQAEVMRISSSMTFAEAIRQSACDLWVDMVCRVDGDKPDIEARKKVMQVIERAITA